MRLIRGYHNLRPEHRGTLATIGNFDGVHLGHQAVFRELIRRARSQGLPATVVTFEPQPQEWFAPESAPARITRLREKLEAIGACGMDQVLVLEFNPQLAAMEAEAFTRRILARDLGVRHLLVGDDFRFGRGRRGDFALLRRLGGELGFGVSDLHTIRHAQDRVSSTRIRRALADGDLDTAHALLGRPYRIAGRVGHGHKRGRRIGFPTANLDLRRRVSPVRGVFAVRVHGLGETPWPGVANVGDRPVLKGDARFLLEVHLFDFAGDLYGRHLQVELVQRLRDERPFDSFESLRRQIELDAAEARARLGAASASLPLST